MAQTEWFTDRLAFYHRDMTDVLPVWAADSIDAAITDPPYGLAELPRKRVEQAMAAWLAGDRTHVPDGRGFMGRDWDKFVPPPGAWDEVYRVLKPGGYLLAFAATRTMDLMGLSIRLAGFEVLDGVGIPGLLAWTYGSGFPKSLDIGKAIDKTAGRIGHSVVDLKIRLQAAFDASGMTRQAVDLACGFRASNYLTLPAEGKRPDPWVHVLPTAEKWAVMRDVLGCGSDLDEMFAAAQREVTGQGYRIRRESDVNITGLSNGKYDITAPATPEAARWDGFGTALKPAWEPVIVARKPLDGTYAANVLKHGAGAMNIAACRVGTGDTLSRRNGSRDNDTAYNSGTWQEGTFGSGDLSGGRWPPNVLLAHAPGCREAGTRKVRSSADGTVPALTGYEGGARRPGRGYSGPDGTETVAAWDCAPGCMVAALDAQSGVLTSGGGDRGTTSRDGLMGPDSDRGRKTRYERDPDTGGASRFYPQFGPDDVPFRYQAKAPRAERPRTADGKSWPTVKPQGLMRWLVRLVVPPGGTCVDPFAGTSATGQALLAEGMRAVLCERDPVAAELSLIRLGLATPEEAMALVRGLEMPQEAPAS